MYLVPRENAQDGSGQKLIKLLAGSSKEKAKKFNSRSNMEIQSNYLEAVCKQVSAWECVLTAHSYCSMSMSKKIVFLMKKHLLEKKTNKQKTQTLSMFGMIFFIVHPAGQQVFVHMQQQLKISSIFCVCVTASIKYMSYVLC